MPPGAMPLLTSLYSDDFDGSPSKRLAEAAAEAGARRVVERELARRQQPDLRHRVERALGVDVEGLDALDVVAEEVEPVRQRAAHREQVDQPAADRVLARRDHLRDVAVAGERELRAQLGDVELLPLLEEEGVRREVRRRREPVQRRRRGDDQHVDLAARRAVERREPLGHQVLVRREVVVGQRFPVRQQRDRESGREPRRPRRRGAARRARRRRRRRPSGGRCRPGRCRPGRPCPAPTTSARPRPGWPPPAARPRARRPSRSAAAARPSARARAAPARAGAARRALWRWRRRGRAQGRRRERRPARASEEPPAPARRPSRQAWRGGARTTGKRTANYTRRRPGAPVDCAGARVP